MSRGRAERARPPTPDAGVSRSRYLLGAALEKGATVPERHMWAVAMLRAEARVQRMEDPLCRLLDEIGSATGSNAQEATVLEAVTEAA